MEMRASQVIKGALGGGAKKKKGERKGEERGEGHLQIQRWGAGCHGYLVTSVEHGGLTFRVKKGRFLSLEKPPLIIHVEVTLDCDWLTHFHTCGKRCDGWLFLFDCKSSVAPETAPMWRSWTGLRDDKWTRWERHALLKYSACDPCTKCLCARKKETPRERRETRCHDATSLGCTGLSAPMGGGGLASRPGRGFKAGPGSS